MASVHIVGELLGASGLSCLSENESFSLFHVLDGVSLYSPSYFCKWRLVVDHPSHSTNDSSSWQVLQGETRGQTQVHAASSGGSLAMPDLYRQSSSTILLPRMDTVWAHPIEFHLVSSLNAWNSWPQLEFQVWGLDTSERETLGGNATVSLPMNTNEYVLDVPLVSPEPVTMLKSLTQAVGLSYDGQEGDSVIRSSGTLYLRLAVLSRGLNTHKLNS